MKAFYIILITFALTVGLVLSCGAYVKKLARETSEELREIEFSSDGECTKKVFELTQSLNRKLSKIEFAIMHQRTDSIKDHADILLIKARNNDRGGFEETKILLLNLLKKISDSESLTLESVF